MHEYQPRVHDWWNFVFGLRYEVAREWYAHHGLSLLAIEHGPGDSSDMKRQFRGGIMYPTFEVDI